MDPRIQVEGLADLSRKLRKLDSEAPKQLRLTLNESAGFLVGRIVPTMPSRTGRARKSVKARSTRTSARVALGGARAPYVPWLDFGGRTGRRRATERRFIKEGRYLYPTLGRERPAIERMLGEGVTAVAVGAGLEVS